MSYYLSYVSWLTPRNIHLEEDESSLSQVHKNFCSEVRDLLLAFILAPQMILILNVFNTSGMCMCLQIP